MNNKKWAQNFNMRRLSSIFCICQVFLLSCFEDPNSDLFCRKCSISRNPIGSSDWYLYSYLLIRRQERYILWANWWSKFGNSLVDWVNTIEHLIHDNKNIPKSAFQHPNKIIFIQFLLELLTHTHGFHSIKYAQKTQANDFGVLHKIHFLSCGSTWKLRG